MSAAVGLRLAPTKRTYRALLPTPANDALVREAYRLYREENSRTAITGLAQKLGVPKWHINRRGLALGLSRSKEAPWSSAEIELLEEFARFTDHVISRKFGERGFMRTATAIHLKLKRTRIRAGVDGYTQWQLQEAFGLDSHTIAKWQKAGWLKGQRRGTARTEKQGGDEWYFSHASVQDFCMAHPDEIDLCKVEKWWFLDLITNGRICR